VDQLDRLSTADSGREPERDPNDSFERLYNKDLDLEEGKFLALSIIASVLSFL